MYVPTTQVGDDIESYSIITDWANMETAFVEFYTTLLSMNKDDFITCTEGRCSRRIVLSDITKAKIKCK